jgi:hypothetical protein
MPRADLLALTLDDLTTLTNPGTVKRACREVESTDYTCELTEEDGSLEARWSDGVECAIPADKVLQEGRCSCPALGLCRHLVRTVLLYQKQQEQQNEEAGTAPSGPAEPWDPGAIDDEELARHYRPAAFQKIRGLFEQGVLVELVRSSKPSARFHLQSCLVRFLVPGDPRYTHCDCAEPAPCGHVPLAVWAFRQLPAEQQAGLLATGAAAPPPPLDLLDDLEQALLDFVDFGISGLPETWRGRLVRLEERCRAENLVWPAEVLADLLQQQDRYASHDSLFSPEAVADLVGELLIRCDAIRNDTGALPQLLIRGARLDRTTTLGAARFVGLGCGVRLRRKRIELTAYLQDTDTGSLVAVRKEFVDQEPEPGKTPRSFADLAHASAAKGSSFAHLGVGQLLIRGAKRTAGRQLLPGRAQASVQPQSFVWERLRAPVLVEEFTELDARLSTLPPASLRPRRVGEDFHVCTVARVESAAFDSSSHTVRAVLQDTQGQRALLVHPYTSRGEAGTEALLAGLHRAPESLRFVSGPVRRTAVGLEIHPVCLVWEEGNTRRALQPWVEQRPGEGEHPPGEPADLSEDAGGEYLRLLQEALGELLVLGLQRSDPRMAQHWRELHHQGEAVGLARLAGRIARLAEALEQKAHTARWESRAAGEALLRVAALVRMAQDLSGE